MLIHGRPIYKETNYRKRDGMAQESGPAAEPSPPDSGKRGQHTQRAFFFCVILIALSLHKVDDCLSYKLCKKWWQHGHGLATQWTNLSILCRFV